MMKRLFFSFETTPVEDFVELLCKEISKVQKSPLPLVRELFYEYSVKSHSWAVFTILVQITSGFWRDSTVTVKIKEISAQPIVAEIFNGRYEEIRYAMERITGALKSEVDYMEKTGRRDAPV